jgi:hypothetical protein
MPHQRDIRSRSVPTYEVEKSHHFKLSESHRDDMKVMVGPIYSSGKIADERKHHFNGGYVAPMSREKREEQVRLVKKFFQKEKLSIENLASKILEKAQILQEKADPIHISREEALRLGQERKREALMRHEIFQVTMKELFNFKFH